MDDHIRRHKAMLGCVDYIHAALQREVANRATNPDGWVEAERMAVALAANEWAVTHGSTTAITVDEVEGLEPMAVGHFDYATKLALYVAEFVYGYRPVRH